MFNEIFGKESLKDYSNYYRVNAHKQNFLCNDANVPLRRGKIGTKWWLTR
jgi:hypothetical protein